MLSSVYIHAYVCIFIHVDCRRKTKYHDSDDTEFPAVRASKMPKVSSRSAARNSLFEVPLPPSLEVCQYIKVFI